jgi:hypothetical protein
MKPFRSSLVAHGGFLGTDSTVPFMSSIGTCCKTDAMHGLFHAMHAELDLLTIVFNCEGVGIGTS